MKYHLLSVSTLCLVVFLLVPANVFSQSVFGGIREGIRERRNILQSLAVERMLKDKGFVRSLINCVLDKGPCDVHGKHLKRLAPEIIRGHCPGCTRNVHNQIRRVISHVQRNFPNEWSEVMSRFLNYPSFQNMQNVFG